MVHEISGVLRRHCDITKKVEFRFVAYKNLMLIKPSMQKSVSPKVYQWQIRFFYWSKQRFSVVLTVCWQMLQ